MRALCRRFPVATCTYRLPLQSFFFFLFFILPFFSLPLARPVPAGPEASALGPGCFLSQPSSPSFPFSVSLSLPSFHAPLVVVPSFSFPFESSHVPWARNLTLPHPSACLRRLWLLLSLSSPHPHSTSVHCFSFSPLPASLEGQATRVLARRVGLGAGRERQARTELSHLRFACAIEGSGRHGMTHCARSRFGPEIRIQRNGDPGRPRPISRCTVPPPPPRRVIHSDRWGEEGAHTQRERAATGTGSRQRAAEGDAARQPLSAQH